MIYEREVRMHRNGEIKDIYGNWHRNFGEFYKRHYPGIKLISIQKVEDTTYGVKEYIYTFWVELEE